MIPSQMLKGILQGCVLAIIGQRETYGYEISQALAQRGFGDISEGTIYPLLLRLEKGGMISARLLASDLGPKRKYYTLTDQGRQTLAEFRINYQELRAAVDRLPGFNKEDSYESKDQGTVEREQSTGESPFPGESGSAD